MPSAWIINRDEPRHAHLAFLILECTNRNQQWQPQYGLLIEMSHVMQI